jgi:GNAT superfamily N-acetyltransferase
VTGPLLPWPLEGARVVLEAARSDSEVAIVRRVDGEPTGSVSLERDGTGVFIVRLCIQDGFRGYGLGSEAARLVLDATAAAGFTHVRAWAPPDLGLAVYFWFRMGLRPVHGAGPNGGIALRRDLSPATATG